MLLDSDEQSTFSANSVTDQQGSQLNANDLKNPLRKLKDPHHVYDHPRFRDNTETLGYDHGKNFDGNDEKEWHVEHNAMRMNPYPNSRQESNRANGYQDINFQGYENTKARDAFNELSTHFVPFQEWRTGSDMNQEYPNLRYFSGEPQGCYDQRWVKDEFEQKGHVLDRFEQNSHVFLRNDRMKHNDYEQDQSIQGKLQISAPHYRLQDLRTEWAHDNVNSQPISAFAPPSESGNYDDVDIWSESNEGAIETLLCPKPLIPPSQVYMPHRLY